MEEENIKNCELIKQNEIMTNLLDIVPCGICLYNWDGENLHPIVVNRQLSEMLGEDAFDYLSEVRGFNYSHVHPDDIEGLRKASYTALTETNEINYCYRSLNKNTGKYLWIRIRGRVIMQENGNGLVYVSYYDVTEEHEAEQKLRESEKMIEFAAEHAGVWYWKYDAANDRVYLDKRNQREFNLEPVIDHFCERGIVIENVLPEYKELYKNSYRRIRNGEKKVTFEIQIILKDNSPHWARYSLINIFDGEGKPVIAVCTGILIDNEKEIWAKYELEKKKAVITDENLLVHAVFNLSTGETLEYNYRDGSEVPISNRDAFLHSRINAAELLIDEEERKKFLELNNIETLLNRFANGETEFRMDYRRLLRGGNVSWVRSILHMVRDPHNNDVLLFEYWYDIEEEKLLELTYYSLTNDKYDFVIRVNTNNSNYVFSLKKLINGRENPESGDNIAVLIDKYIKEKIIPEDSDITRANISVSGIKTNLESQERFQFNCREMSKEGSFRYKKITEFYLDRVRGIAMITCEDITETIKTETEKNEMLVAALNAASLANHAKSQFLSRVSHELRTPLNAIIGFMELAKDADQRQIAKYMNNSNIAAKQLLSVINDVLDMSSIESGKMKIAHATFDFKSLLSSITNMFLTQCQEKGVIYETRILTPLDEWLVGDQLRVNQILLNLLNNSVKFTNKGHIWLQISQTESVNNQVFIRFTISDTGCGMNKNMLERLFKPFEQESAVTAQRYGGNGLGLSIVYNLVEMMDGVISVESQVDKGSTFIIDIPFIRSEINRELQLPDGMNNIRVLAVDDEEAERKYLSIVLGRIGIRHTCIDGGAEALRLLEESIEKKDPYSICLIDWKMPLMNGMEITERIRNMYGKDVIVIVVSAYEHNQADERAKAAGANLFVPKPLFQSTLFDLFMTLTNGSIAKKEISTVVYDFKGKRVLLAEDNAMNRLVAEGLVKRFGILCDSVIDGEMAVDKFTNSPEGYYDAILMDVQMPGMDGFEATIAIRESSHVEAKTIQIIALTANAFNEDIARALSCGMNAHVAKPIEPSMLAEALSKAFLAKASEILI